MRMRRKKHATERMDAMSTYLLTQPEEPQGSASAFFPQDGKLELEIGCGKGSFACEFAKRYPDVCLIAFEKVHDVLLLAMEQADRRKEERTKDNLRFILGDAKDLPLWFKESSLDTIYLNFSDPWPKARHAKRRLTCAAMLKSYFPLIKEGGHLYFKTDNRPLFDFTLEELASLQIEPDFVTYDLHASEWNEKNIVTEYETNFSNKGFSINAVGITIHHTKE